MDNNKEENFTVITRKYHIIPIQSEQKEWEKRVRKFLKEDSEGKIEYFKKKLKTAEKKDKEKIKGGIEYHEERIKTIESGCEFTQKMIDDYTRNLVQNAMQEEAYRKNYILAWIFSEMTAVRVDQMDSLKEKYKFISDTINYAYRKRGSKKGSLFDATEITSILKSYGIAFSKEFTGKIKTLVKNGWLEGKVSCPNYKSDSPFTIAKSHFSFDHDYDSFEELCEHINEPECKMYINYGGNNSKTGTNPASLARFRIDLGHGKNRNEIKSTLLKVYSGEYQYCGSKIGISGNKIILYLSIKVPKVKMELDENTVVGVDLGIAIPAMCALNNNMYERLSVGNVNDFVRIRTKYQSQRRRLQKSLKFANGEHGLKKKMRALERLKKAESHFAETYCHMVSKRVVDFAVNHNAKYINIENLTGYDTSNFVLSNWSYYKLQQYITYKADRYGIVTRKINPCYTSQVCSVCGHWESGQRKTQSEFECANPDCASHKKYKYGFNADFNAARNIAMSTLFMESGKVEEKNKKEAREYYGINTVA